MQSRRVNPEKKLELERNTHNGAIRKQCKSSWKNLESTQNTIRQLGNSWITKWHNEIWAFLLQNCFQSNVNDKLEWETVQLEGRYGITI